jgi:hypothetical protein
LKISKQISDRYPFTINADQTEIHFTLNQNNLFTVVPMKSRSIIFIVAAATVGMLTLAMNSRPLQIEYHKYFLERLHEAIYDEPTVTSGGLVGYGDRNQFERQEQHCNRLATLGYFFHKRYDMDKLPDTGEVHSAFWRLVQSEFPNRRYPTLSYPDNVLEVWDLAECEAEWDEFVERHNVPDFADRFIVQTQNGEIE